ncbi:TPA: phage scaffolding protein [Clostridioides difficile]|uniref:phage scaffolding protein n=1 Tax=Clostridioides difficile TaxID=1496 RepID=UPI0009433F37|nr:phage scaffolding protein [Clostridioides difficile]MBJ9770693.1 phage scaffolding protein [Clostridioides difficile]MDV9570520.1 phage scaffolding protein [Clostridioides difficile]MDV9583865.1 phage scaffolding protein [Clostridioides difficile]MDV9611199.1 phage scaffolding protein [Clostridioides difficile]MDV9623004.1 phage scaffolding protein [Clostridioides difficile]
MKKGELIALGLSEEDAKKVEVESLKELDNYINKIEYEKVKEELKASKEAIEGFKDGMTKEQIEELKKGYETKLTAKDEEYQKKLKEKEQKEFDMALENELIKLNVHSTKAAKAELDLEKIKYENGTFTGLKEQTDTWSTQKSFLIKTGKTKINYSPDNGNENTLSRAESIAKEKNEEGSKNPYADAWSIK